MPYYFGINVGENEYQAVAQNSDPSKDIEIVIPTEANVPSVKDLLLAIDKLENFILRQGKVW